MAPVLILTETDLRRIVQLDAQVVDCVEQAFVALATQAVEMPPVMRLDISAHRGEVDIKTAYIPQLGSFAIKVSPGFFNNPALGLPSTNGLMMLLSAHTGLVEALLLDNGYLTDVRTAAAGAVAARHLARPDAKIAALFGAGMQARMQLRALTLVRPIELARIWARDEDKARRVAAELTAELGFPVIAEADPAKACRGADIIVTTTPSVTPILRAGWLKPGQHVTAMGSDAEHKNEIEPAAIIAATPYVADSLKQTRRLGELHHAIVAGLAGDDTPFAELGAIVCGRTAGRPSRDAITLCDLTGTGVQDTAIAALAHQRAVQVGAGRTIETTKASGDIA
jgi:ornithine cyclodeaminase